MRYYTLLASRRVYAFHSPDSGFEDHAEGELITMREKFYEKRWAWPSDRRETAAPVLISGKAVGQPGRDLPVLEFRRGRAGPEIGSIYDPKLEIKPIQEEPGVRRFLAKYADMEIEFVIAEDR